MPAEDYLPDEFSEEEVAELTSVVCKYCGAKGLRWTSLKPLRPRDKPTYRLLNADNTFHTCGKYTKENTNEKLPKPNARNS